MEGEKAAYEPDDGMPRAEQWGSMLQKDDGVYKRLRNSLAHFEKIQDRACEFIDKELNTRLYWR